jgi:hypothetical protein
MSPAIAIPVADGRPVVHAHRIGPLDVPPRAGPAPVFLPFSFWFFQFGLLAPAARSHGLARGIGALGRALAPSIYAARWHDAKCVFSRADARRRLQVGVMRKARDVCRV